MNGIRIVGQILLWAGFLSAALAAVSQKDFDLLPDNERKLLNELDEDFSLPFDKFSEVSTKPIAELSEKELGVLLTKSTSLFDEHQAELEVKRKLAELSGNPLDEPKDSKKKPPVDTKKFITERLKLVDNKWPAIPWLWFGLSMAVGTVGVVLLRSTAKSAEQDSLRVSQDFSTVTESLGKITANVTRLQNNLSKMAPGEIVYFIDNDCAEHFGNFAEARNSLIQRFGLQAYADIMTEFASAERFINRSWSAAADGYINEVTASVARAQAHLKNANRLIDEHQTNDERGG